MINFFSNIFGYVLNWIYLLVQNYGLAIIIFSVLIKILMLPLSIKQQRTLKINEKLQKEIKILQIKYKGNQEKINQETMELYKREKVNPLSGCFTIIIQFILILSMFYLVRSPLTYMKKIDNTRIEEQINIVKETNENQNINNSYPEIAIIRYLQENNMKENDMYINMNFLGLDLSKVPQENLKDITVYIIPVLYVISSIISIKFTTNLSKNKNKEEVEESKDLINTKENKEIDQEEMAMQMNKNMSLMMPILSVSISLLAPLGLALYWLINNIIMIIERLVLNKFFSKEENENAKYYIHVLEEKSQRLKQLTEDLVETSKITSGNVKLNMQKLDLVELLYQTGGEFNERFESRNLTIVTKIPSEQIFIYADGRQLYRSIENLYTNAAKYALENTRVYVELEKADTKAVFTIKNVSKNELDIVSNGNVDLTERFVRGERSRTTEGSGLGLSIAKNLTHLMGGKFEIKVDGDLFIATITYNII